MKMTPFKIRGLVFVHDFLQLPDYLSIGNGNFCNGAKNHPFTDGNKRIGALIFIWFLQRNKHLLKKNGEAKINDNALVAITLLVAQSQPNQKKVMIDLIINLIKKESVG